MTPQEQRLYEHYTQALKLNSEVANTLARDEKLSHFFDEAIEVYNSPVAIANIVANEVARELKHHELEALLFSPKQIAELIKMTDDGKISGKIAREVFEEMVASGEDPGKIVERKGLEQISDPAQILPIVEEIIENNPENVEKYKAGNTKLHGFFVGQVLKATGGKANPKVVNTLVAECLNR